MDIEQVRNLIREKYYEFDSKSSHLFLLAVLFEEVGELAEAVRKKELESIEEELADVLFMVLSLANYFDVVPERKLVEKYIEGDPSGRWDME
jgi:NTP pyrophosphatase (non-canonical NTP hydrolase)